MKMEPDVELMYKAPGAKEHKSIVEVLDEIITKIKDLERKVDQIQTKLSN